MRILFIGDIVGKPGRHICKQAVRGLRARRTSTSSWPTPKTPPAGSGITPEIYHELINAGIDGITLGDHAFRRREIFPILQTERRIVRAANYPAAAPGHDYAILRTRQHGGVAIFTLLGRVFMPPIDCPFTAADRVLAALPADVRVILLDFHAEATSDKQLMGRHLDGRVSAVLGTHTHVPTADEEILARRHRVPVRRRHDRPAREHSGPSHRSRDGNDSHLPPDPLRGGRRRRAAQRQHRRHRPGNRPRDRHPANLHR